MEKSTPEEPEQPARPQEKQDPLKQIFDFDREVEDQKKKDIELFKSYGLLTKEDVEAHVKPFVEALQRDNAALREEFLAFKEWALRKKAQGLNSGGIENPKPTDPMAGWRAAW